MTNAYILNELKCVCSEMCRRRSVLPSLLTLKGGCCKTAPLPHVARVIFTLEQFEVTAEMGATFPKQSQVFFTL